MVENQIVARGIRDEAVLKAMRAVQRHLLVPEEQRGRAYMDNPLPIGFGQTISQPFIVALMTEQLKLKSDYKVLEIGTGSGYQAAILAEIVREVYSVEIIPELALRADRDLKALGYKNIHIKSGDGHQGWAAHAFFDAIIVTAAARTVPPPLLAQLKLGGILCLPIGLPDSVQTLKRICKIGAEIFKTEEIVKVRFVPMTGND